MKLEDSETFLSVRQAADRLGCTRSYVYELLRAGRIPHLRYGGRGLIRIERSAIDAFIEQSRVAV